jgi:hypothetical protein
MSRVWHHVLAFLSQKQMFKEMVHGEMQEGRNCLKMACLLACNSKRKVSGKKMHLTSGSAHVKDTSQLL